MASRTLPARRKLDVSHLSIEQQIALGFLDPRDIPADISSRDLNSGCPKTDQKAGSVSADISADTMKVLGGAKIVDGIPPRTKEVDPCGRPLYLPSGEVNPEWDPFEDPPEVREKVLAQREVDRAKLVERQEALERRGAIPRRGQKPPPAPAPGAGMPEARFSEMPEEARKKADHNARSKKHLEAQGYSYYRVDHYDARTGRSHDLFGVFDALAFGPKGIIGVQLTSAENMVARKAKIRKWAGLTAWYAAGASVLVLGWKKEGARYEPVEAHMRKVMD